MIISSSNCQLIINLFLHIIGHKETLEERLSPSKRMKTEESNAEIIVELGKTLPKKRSMVNTNYCNIIGKW